MVMQAKIIKLYSVVTDINGFNEIIKEGENGTIIPVKDASALFQKMLYFCEHKTTMYHPETCKAIIIENYERSYIWQELLKEYQGLN
jgi:glycosyltransferase involved in cell wall biosynthesis